ncbi:MAG: branched-chain amino acid ABC transporter permease [Desulfobacterales bacterium]
MRRYVLLSGMIFVACLLPLVFSEAFHQHIFITIVINSILAVSLGIVVGYLGELSLAHGAFFGIGAYTSALISINLNVPFFVALPLAVLFAGIMGYLIGIPALRLSGHYFAIATLGFQGIVILMIINLVDLTRGPMGLGGIPPVGPYHIFGLTISFLQKLPYYYLALAVLLIVLLITRNLLRYKFGQAFIATREDPLLAASIGIKTGRFRLLAFSLSAAMAGAAGSLYAHYALFISPDSFHLSESIYIATMVIIGGRATILGPLIGAIVLTAVPEALRFAGGLQFVLYGLMLMVVVIFMPKGLVGLLDRFKRKSRSVQLTTLEG